MNSQTSGLAEAIGVSYVLLPARVVMPWALLPTAWLPHSLSVLEGSRELKTGIPPELIITCGRHGTVAALALKRRFGDRIYTVHIQDPKISTRHFDLVVAPEHDGLKGENVYQTTGALHYVTSERLAQARSSPESMVIGDDVRPLVAVLLGGRNGYYDFTVAEALGLVAALKRLISARDVRLMVLSSNRTPASVVRVCRDAFGEEHYVWDGIGANPYFATLARAAYFVVTGDSVSMVSEAAATGRPVFVHHLPKRRAARRFDRFHATFEEAGITRPFTGSLDDWAYEIPTDTPRIAALIRERIGFR